MDEQVAWEAFQDWWKQFGATDVYIVSSTSYVKRVVIAGLTRKSMFEGKPINLIELIFRVHAAFPGWAVREVMLSGQHDGDLELEVR